MVEDPKLLDAFQLADERLVVPSRSKLKGAVKKQYDEKKAGGNSFRAVNFHLISEDFHVKKKQIEKGLTVRTLKQK